MSVKTIGNLRDLNLNSLSISENITRGSTSTLEDIIQDVDQKDASHQFFARENLYLLTKGILRLSDKEKKILFMRFGLHGFKPHSLSETGRAFQLSTERIRQIQITVISKLKKYVDNIYKENNDYELFTNTN